MIIFPDIEIQNGQSVNRIRGKENEPEVYDISPLEAANKFVSAGAEWLHVVDLDSSLRENRSNTELIRQIVAAVDVPVQVGGGIRTFLDVEWWLEQGAARVVLGTTAVVDRHLIMDICGRFPSQIVISITGKDGYAMIDGWRTKTSFTTLALAKSLEGTGAAAIIYTDLDRFEGGQAVGIASTIEMGTELEIPLISTGTVDTLDDVSALTLLPNIEGVIIGRALFEGAMKLAAAIEVARASQVAPELAEQGVAPTLDKVSGIPIRNIDHVSIFISDLDRSVNFYEILGFAKEEDCGFSEGRPVVMRHHSGVAINLLNQQEPDEGRAQIALEVSSLSQTRAFMKYNGIDITDSYDYGTSGAVYVKDPDNNLIELDRYR
ncbi:MAG: 1-(5-phosphoribosyl)-5-[(5-phosphoribosylamino)methylideneamino] imidazole-4-carboxamide isomerase [Gammaproteobacteria bacterium]|nr:1-(5-phosphoribosyl)-5-[(5-phosphoribosylamino)methylideneamino] imidazole-4-carboxamide isomerase [Gammaproteobacteria bacterium]